MSDEVASLYDPVEWPPVRYSQATVDDLIAKAVAAERGRILSLLTRYWTFGNDQQHTHTWHGMQDCFAAIRAGG